MNLCSQIDAFHWLQESRLGSRFSLSWRGAADPCFLIGILPHNRQVAGGVDAVLRAVGRVGQNVDGLLNIGGGLRLRHGLRRQNNCPHEQRRKHPITGTVVSMCAPPSHCCV